MAKSVGSQLQLNKIPVLGLVPESSATASPPTSPTNGQLWYDTTVNRLYVRENGAWVLASQTGAELAANKGATNGYAALVSGTVPIAQIPTGTTSSTVTIGNDTRLSDSRNPTGSAGGDLTGTYPAPTIANLAVTDAKVAAANKDGAAGTPSMRTLAFTSTTAMPGNARIDQIAVPTASVSHGNQELTNLGAPTSSTSAARLQDVQNAQAGIDLKPSVRAASTANVNIATGLANGQVIDGVTLVTGDRVLLKNQTTASQNGSYIASASGAASRTTDAIDANALWFVEEGTTQADTSWMVTTNNPITLGTTSLTLAQFGANTTYSGTTNRISVTGTVIDIHSAYVGQTSITTLGTITTGTWNGTSVAVANGGTGATTASAARANLGTTGKYAATLAAMTAGVELNINHALNTTDVQAMFRDASSGYDTLLSWRVIDANNIGVTADINYSASALRTVVIG